MTASEKLKALDGEMTDMSPFGSSGAAVYDVTLKEDAAKNYVALRNALPQIVAVVKADEGLLAFLEAFLSHEHKQPFFTLRSLVREQRAALAALEDVLR